MKKYLKLFSQWLKPDKTYSINRTKTTFTCKENRDDVSPKIWTDAQEKDLDKRFGELRNEMNQKFNLIIEILARNGIK